MATDSYLNNIPTVGKDPYLTKVSSNAKHEPYKSQEDERLYTPDMPEGLSVGSLLRQLDVNAAVPSAQDDQTVSDMTDYLTGFYLQKSSQDEALSPEDKVFASMIMSTMTGRDTKEIINNFDKYSKAFTGIDTGKNWFQNFWQYFSGHWDRNEISNATMALTEIPYDSPRRQYYEKYLNDLKENYAKKTANVSTEKGFLRQFAQSGDVTGQRADQLMRSIETGLILAGAASLMLSGAGAPVGLTVGTSATLGAIQTANAVRKAYTLGSVASTVKYNVVNMAKAEASEAADRLMSMVDENGNRIPLEIIREYAYNGGLLSALVEMSDDLISGFLTPIGEMRWGKKTVKEAVASIRSLIRNKPLKYGLGFAANTGFQIGQEGFQGWIREKYIDEAVKKSNEIGATNFTNYTPKSAAADTSWELIWNEAKESLPSMAISELLFAGAGAAVGAASGPVSYVMTSLERKMEVTSQMKSDANKYFTGDKGKVYDIRYFDTVGADPVDPNANKQTKEGEKAEEPKKRGPVIFSVNKETGALVPMTQRDRAYVEFLRENGVTGIRGIQISDRAISEAGNIGSAGRMAELLDAFMDNGAVVGTEGSTIVFNSQESLNNAVADLDEVRDALSLYKDSVEFVKNKDGSYTIHYENSTGRLQNFNLRVQTEQDKITQTTQNEQGEEVTEGNITPVSRPMEANLSDFRHNVNRSEAQWLADDDVEDASKTFLSQLTGIERTEINRLWKEDFQTVLDKLPKGVDLNVVEQGARFMPLLSQITGKTTKQLLNDDKNVISLVYGGEAETVLDSKGKAHKARGAFNRSYNKKTGVTTYTIRLTDMASEEGGDTLVHELMHIARRMASKDRLAGFYKAYGKSDLWLEDIKEQDGKYVFDGVTYDTRDEAEREASKMEEKFVKDFFSYLKTGEAPNAEVKSFFDQLKQFLQSFVNTYKDQMSPEVKQAFDKLLNGELDVSKGQTIDEAVKASEATLTDEVADNTLNSLTDGQWQTMDSNTQRRIEADYEATRNKYFGTDQWMKAPNGKPTNLTERQWVQVRTPAFKAWFGDWENDPENASKVVDENGEPLVVYHGTKNFGFTVFSPQNSESSFGDYKFSNNFVAYFATDKMSARSFTGRWSEAEVYDVFLNIRNPYVVNNLAEKGERNSFNIKDKTLRDYQLAQFETLKDKWEYRKFRSSDTEEINDDLRVFGMFVVPRGDGDFDVVKRGNNSMFGADRTITYGSNNELEDDNWEDIWNEIYDEEYPNDYYLSTDDVVNIVLAMNREGTAYDGIYIEDVFDSSSFGGENSDYITIESPNQIKSATDNIGTFSADNDSILYSLAPATDSEEFHQWFDGSKVVDADGNPLVVYHGSPIKGIDEFNPRGATNGGEGLIYATDDRSTADRFSLEFTEGSSAFRNRATGNVGQVYPVYMDLKNPLDFRNLTEKDKQVLVEAYERLWHGDNGRELLDEVLGYGNHQYIKSMAWDVIQNLEDYGYDGLIANMNNNVLEYAAVRPDQVKRVQGNTSTTLYSLQSSGLDLDFFRNGGTIRYGENGQSELEQYNSDRASDSAGLRGLIEYDSSDGRDNGWLLQWGPRGDEIQSGTRRTSQRPYLSRSDIAPRGSGPVSGLYRNRLLQRLNSVKGTNYTGVVFYELNKTTSALNKFINALDFARSSNPTGLLVSPKSLKELKSDNVRVFLSGDGNTGYAIEYDHDNVQGLNNLVAVFNTSMNGQTTKGAVYSILADAIEHGANILDCYANDGLVRSYSQMGFIPTGRVKFTDEYLSEDEKKVFKANKAQMQKPVVAMYYSDRDINDTMDKLADRQGRKWEDAPVSSYPSDGYDSALRERDSIARDRIFGDDANYRMNPDNYRLGTRVGGAIGPNPSPLSEATGHGLQRWEKIEGRESIAEKIATALTGGPYKVMKDGTALTLPSPIPVKRKTGESAIHYLRRVADYGAKNIKTVFDVLTDALKIREKKWYDTAHALAVSMTNKYGLSIGQSAALIAVLSPNYEWTNNYTLADIVADIMVNAKDSKPSQMMLDYVRDVYHWEESRIETFRNQTLGEMNETDAKDFIYAAIQSGEIDKSYMASLSIGMGLTGQSDQQFGMTIGTGNAIVKAISVMRDGSLSNINAQIGNEAKVRSFYNNILSPNSDRAEITADTWALRDFFLGMNPQYSEIMRNILFGGAGGSGTGLPAVVNEGFRIAADLINKESAEKYLPHQIQSIVWTGIKSAWDNVDNEGKREELESAWQNGDIQKIRDVFTDLIQKHEPQIADVSIVEGVTLSRRGKNATIFREGTSSAKYNNLGNLIEESHRQTQEAARNYSESGGRKSLDDVVLFSLSPERQAEVLEQRRNEIQRAVENGIFVRTEFLNEFRGQDWADRELELRDWILENPQVIGMAKDSDTVEEFKKKYEESQKKANEDEDIPFEEPTEEDDASDQWFQNIFSYAHALSSQDRDRAFVAEWTSSEDKTLELANALRNYKDAQFKSNSRSGGYWYVKNTYGAFKGVSTKLLRLRDGKSLRTNQKERSSSAEIQEAQELIRQNPSAYRRAYLIAQMAESRANQVRQGMQKNIGEEADWMLLEQIDDDIAREMSEVEEAYEAERRPKVDYKANIADIRKKITDAENDIRKAGEDPLTFNAEKAKEDLKGMRQRLKELNAIIHSGVKETDKIVERMGTKIEQEQYKKVRAEQRADFLLAYAKEKKRQFEKEEKRLTNALDAMRRRMEAKEASEYRQKRIRQIRRLSNFNPSSLDATFEDSLVWIHGLFDRTEEDATYRKSIDERIAEKKQEIDMLTYQNEDTTQAKQELLMLQKQKKISRMVTPPAQLRAFLPATVRADNRQSQWTAEELDTLLSGLKAMRAVGKQMLEEKQRARMERLLNVSYGYFNEVTGMMGSLTEEGEKSARLLGEDIKKNLKEGQEAKGFKRYVLWNAKLQRLARILDGDREGILYDWFVRENYRHQSEEIDGIRTRLDKGSKKWSELGLKASDLSKEGYKGVKTNGTEYSLTRGQMIGVYIYNKSELGEEKLVHINGNEISEKSIKEIINQLTREEIEWAEFLLADMKETYPRVRDVYYRGWNMDLGERENYFTLVASDSVSQEKLEAMGMDPQGDLVGKDGKAYPDKSFTKMVNPNAIYPLDLDVTRTWARQVRKQEHFIAYGEWAKDTQYLLDQGQVKETAERVFGITEAKNFNKIVNSVIGGQMSNNDFDRAWLRVLASRNSAVLIGNVGTIMKQAPSFFAAFNGDVSMRNLINGKGTLENFLAEHPDIASLFPDVESPIDFIYANAPEMKDRQIDIDIMESLNRMEGGAVENALRTANSKISKYTMQLLDKMVVNSLWMSRYYTVFEEQKAQNKTDLQAHREAAFKASQFISETQPTAMKMDQSASQVDSKTSALLRGIMVFTNQTMNTYNQLFHDVPMAFRQGNWKKGIQKIASTMLIMGAVAALSGRFFRKGNEDDEKYAWRVARELAATMLQTSFPAFGSIVSSALEYDSEYSTYIFGLDTLGSSLRKITTPSKTQSAWDKIADIMIDLGTEAGYAIGVPVTPIKNVVKSVKKGEAGYLLGGKWGEIIESYR